MEQKKIKFLKRFLYYPVLVISCFEIALLLLGYRSYKTTLYKVETHPANAFIGDSLLGIQLNPGNYQITLNDSVTFHATHDINGKRVTVNQPNFNDKQIVMLGCSFTYGYGVNDNETFTSLLQACKP